MNIRKILTAAVAFAIFGLFSAMLIYKERAEHFAQELGLRDAQIKSLEACIRFEQEHNKKLNEALNDMEALRVEQESELQKYIKELRVVKETTPQVKEILKQPIPSSVLRGLQSFQKTSE